MDNVKTKIIKAAAELLNEKDINAITSRDIAARAQVSIGNINYNFESKDEVLSLAVQQNFLHDVRLFKRKTVEIINPKKELMHIMEEFLTRLIKYKHLSRFALKYKLTKRTFNSERYLLPYIAKYLEGKPVSPLEIKLKAMQINAVFSVAFFNTEEFFKYSDLDLYNPDDVKKMITALIDSVLE